MSASSALRRFGNSKQSGASRYILQLQKQYGNRYVQRALTLAKRDAVGKHVDPEVESRIERKRGGGHGSDSRVRGEMESHFGSDFSGVRVHTDGESDALSRAVDAMAFTIDPDTSAGAGKYDPGQSAGKEPLARELTHVVQQGGGSTIPGKLALSDPDDAQEREADTVAREVAGGPSQPLDRVVERDSVAGGGVQTEGTAPALQRLAQDEPTPSGTGTPESAPAGPAPSGPASSEPAPAAPGAAPTPTTPGGQASGTVADIVTPAGEGRATGAEQVADKPMPQGPSNVVANIKLDFSQPKTDRNNGSKHDAVTSGVTVGPLTQPGGRAVSPFGEEFYEPAFTAISYASAGGKYAITATLNVICPWGTSSGGRTDVPSATSSVVTAAKWPDIKADLLPGTTSPFKSPRNTYYSQTLVERHEQFHGTDDFGWSKSSGIGIVKTFLEAGTVSSGTAAADVAALLGDAKTKLIAENFKWYQGGGTAHDSYAGEIRAYADGRPLYQKLATDVEAYGKTLKP